MRNFAIGLALISVTVLLSGCASPGGPSSSPERLRVGVTPTAPPLVYKQGRELVGLEVDFARGLADVLGRTASFVEVDWTDLIPALLDGRIDVVMSGMSVTQERAVRVAFSEPYLRVGQLALYRAEDRARFANPMSVVVMKGRVGVERGTTGDLLVRERFRLAKRVPFDSPEEAARALVKKKVDVVLHDAPVSWWLASEHQAEGLVVASAPLTEEYLAWGFRPQDVALRKKANAYLAGLVEEGRLNEMVDQWIPFAR